MILLEEDLDDRRSGYFWCFKKSVLLSRYVSYILPQTFACEAMRGILLRGWGLTYMPVWRGFVVTIAWIVATYAIFKKLVSRETWVAFCSVSTCFCCASIKDSHLRVISRQRAKKRHFAFARAATFYTRGLEFDPKNSSNASLALKQFWSRQEMLLVVFRSAGENFSLSNAGLVSVRFRCSVPTAAP